MVKKGLLSFFLVIAAVILLSGIAAATVDVSQVVVTPSTANTSSTLNCAFLIVGNETSYTASVTWFKNSTAHTSDDESFSSVSNNTATSTNSAGDIEAADTAKGDVWICQVTAQDSSGNTDYLNSASVTIQNSAPVITSSAETSATIDSSYSYNVDATDADSDTLTYSLTTAPDGMTINSATGLISWTPNASQEGSNSVTVSVSDGTATDTQSFTITVLKKMLKVSDLDAKCEPDSCDDQLSETNANLGEGGDIESVRPGSTLTLYLQAKNYWDEDTDDHQIEDIEIKCTLEELGDEDEQEVTEDIRDLDPDEESNTARLEFDIPKEVDEGTYTMSCELTGEDEDGTDYEVDFDIDVKVEKERHKVTFVRYDLFPSTVSCDRDVTLTMKVKNIGQRDEDDVKIVTRNNLIKLADTKIISELQEGDYDDDDTEYTYELKFTVADNIKAGSYTIRSVVYYNDEDDSEVKEAKLIVTDCKPATTGTSSGSSSQEASSGSKEDKEEVVVVTQPTITTGQQPTQATAKPITTITKETESFYDSEWFIVTAIVLIVALSAAATWMLIILLKK